MRPIEIVTKINIPSDVFIENVKGKISTYKKDTLETLFSVEPHFQWDNVRIKGNQLTIERSAKPFDRTSRYRGVSGIIQSEIIPDNDETILKTKITLDTAMANFIKYAFGTVIGMIGISWMILEFNYIVLCFVIGLEGYIFGVIP